MLGGAQPGTGLDISATSTDTGSARPTANLITRNLFDGNVPDITDAGADNEFSRNDCSTSVPEAICS